MSPMEQFNIFLCCIAFNHTALHVAPPYWAQAPSTQYYVTMSPLHAFSRLHARKFQVTNPPSVGEIDHYLIGLRLPFFLRSARFSQYSFELGSKGLRCIRTFGYFHHWQTSV